MNQNSFTVDEIISSNDGIINDKYASNQKMIEFALNYICDYDKQTMTYTLNSQKIIKSVAMALLTVKGSFHLKEFISVLKHGIDLALPIDLQSLSVNDSESSFDPITNLFENYKGYDLTFLKGNAVIIPSSELRMVNKTDDAIKLLDPFYSPEFRGCYGNAEKRLEVMFEIKDKWTHSELVQYISQFIDIGVNFDNFLMKNTRILRDKNPFDPSRDINYYLKKF